MKRTLPLLLFTILLTGCWDRHELNELALVRGVGLDLLENGLIELSVEVTLPQPASGSQTSESQVGSAGTTQSTVRSGQGRTITEALEKLQKLIPRKIFWGHAEVIIINQKLARNKIRGKIDYMMRDPDFRLHAFVFVANKENSAKDILTLQTRLYSPSEVLWDMADSKGMVHVSLINLLDMLNSGDAMIPIIDKVPSSRGFKKNQTTPYIKETAVFKGESMAGIIDDQLTRGAKWLQNDIEETQITVHSVKGEGYISFSLLRAKTKLEPQIENGKWKMIIKTRTANDILQNDSTLNLKDPKNIQELERELEKEISGRLTRTIQTVQKKYKADIFGFGRAFQRKYPQEWKKSKAKWDEIYPELEVTVKPEAVILRPGAGTAHK